MSGRGALVDPGQKPTHLRSAETKAILIDITVCEPHAGQKLREGLASGQFAETAPPVVRVACRAES